MSIKSEYIEAKVAYDRAKDAYDARIAELDVQGRIERAATIDELDGIDRLIRRIADEHHLRDLRAEMNIAADRLISWSLDIANAMRPSLDLRGLRNYDACRAKLIELALTLPD